MLKTPVTELGAQVPEDQWEEFCERLTRAHYGWSTGIYQLGRFEAEADEHSLEDADRLFEPPRPLQELRAGHRDGSGEVIVTVGEGEDETSYLVEGVVAISAREIGDSPQRLRLDPDRGTPTVIELRPPAAADASTGDDRPPAGPRS